MSGVHLHSLQRDSAVEVLLPSRGRKVERYDQPECSVRLFRAYCNARHEFDLHLAPLDFPHRLHPLRFGSASQVGRGEKLHKG